MPRRRTPTIRRTVEVEVVVEEVEAVEEQVVVEVITMPNGHDQKKSWVKVTRRSLGC